MSRGEWLIDIGWKEWSMEPIQADASFRNYFRLKKETETYILMDSSLMLDSLPLFVDINKRLKSANVKVPTIIAKDIILGYLILEDFGSLDFFDACKSESNYLILYKKAIDEMVKMQKSDTANLPLYDSNFLQFEMDLMQDWYINKHLNIDINAYEKDTIQRATHSIIKVVAQQPKGIFVHRDFHSRNMIITLDDSIGIIDFQDARNGFLTYDLVSLLRDSYIELPKDDVVLLALYFKESIGLNIEDKKFIKWFDFMGMQRQIKILGIFSRLDIRDGKSRYLKDIPLTLKYLLDVASSYDETKELAELLLDMTKKGI